jgi:uncharacterized circularly permuted ATP-grasp superfamily protein/uncharacterized alpha-E superfamily protein
MTAAAQKTKASSIAAGYAAGTGFDELVGRDGALAPHWQQIIAALDALSPEERVRRVERINARVRETGIAHDVFADPSRNVQPWRLDLLPLALTQGEWETIEAAVIQRARLSEAIIDDIYGAQDLMRRGLIPPQLVLSDPAFLRPCRGLGPAGARLQFLAVDLARDPQGSWRVVDMHAETPAGIGYALANRTVLTHVCGDIFSASRAVRLAPYFQRIQEALAQRINRPDPSIALLTPGPHHSDFFSHAYLARYLGALLVEGGDLRVDNDRIYLKTLEGLRPIDMILRSAAAAQCDALELEPSGFLGPVGLVQAVRRQPGLVVNALGTAVVENRGLGRYLPQLARELLGEDLLFPDVNKVWLGDPQVGRSIVPDLDRYFIRRASEQTARPGQAAAPIDATRLSAAEREALAETIQIEGHRLVAEEKVALGTTPCFGSGELEPTSYALRVFAGAVQDGFIVMPGGLAMTVAPGATMALTAPDGASRDVWVLSDKPQPAFKSLWVPTIEAAHVQRGPRELPSRTADNLFWLGRYVENADWTFRLLRNCLARVEEDSGPRQNLRLSKAALLAELERESTSPVVVPTGLTQQQTIMQLSRMLMTAPDRPYGLQQTLRNMHRVASLSRDRLSLEAWRTLNAFYAGRSWQARDIPTSIGASLDLIDNGLAVIAAFNGLSHENMTRNHGWAFLDLGRRVSRALNMSRILLAAFATTDPEQEEASSLLFVLELADSFITYRSRYRLDPLLPLVLDLLMIDETNPRSLAFQLAAVVEHIDDLPQTGKGRGRTEVQRQALALLSDVRLADVAGLAEAKPNGAREALAHLLRLQVERIPLLSDAITRRYFSMLEREPRWIRASSRSVT